MRRPRVRRLLAAAVPTAAVGLALALALAVQLPAGAAGFVDRGRACNSGPNGTVCVAVRQTADGHLYGRVGLDAAPGTTLCTYYIGFSHGPVWPFVDNLYTDYAKHCVTGGRLDILTNAASSRCSSDPFFSDTEYTVNNSDLRDLVSLPAFFTC